MCNVLPAVIMGAGPSLALQQIPSGENQVKSLGKTGNIEETEFSLDN
jgi:hypothetical protein